MQQTNPRRHLAIVRPSCYMCDIIVRPRQLPVTESLCSRLYQAGGSMPQTQRFNFVIGSAGAAADPPGRLIAAAVVLQW